MQRFLHSCHPLRRGPATTIRMHYSVQPKQMVPEMLTTSTTNWSGTSIPLSSNSPTGARSSMCFGGGTTTSSGTRGYHVWHATIMPSHVSLILSCSLPDLTLSEKQHQSMSSVYSAAAGTFTLSVATDCQRSRFGHSSVLETGLAPGS